MTAEQKSQKSFLGRIRHSTTRSSRIRIALLSLATMVSSLFLAKAVMAAAKQRIDDEALTLGRTLAEFVARRPGPRGNDTEAAAERPRTQRVRFNGLDMLTRSVHVQATSAEVDALFSEFRAQCQPNTRPRLDSEPVLPELGAPVLQSRNAEESYFYCIKPRHDLTVSGLARAADELRHSKDLARVGTFFGAYVRSRGDAHQMLLMQLEGRVDIEQAFDRAQDVPGQDMSHLVRPPGRRAASLSLDGRPQFNMYATAGDPARLLEEYRIQLESTGTTVIAVPRPDHERSRSLVAQTAGDTYLILTHQPDSTRDDAAQSFVSITRLVR